MSTINEWESGDGIVPEQREQRNVLKLRPLEEKHFEVLDIVCHISEKFGKLKESCWIPKESLTIFYKSSFDFERFLNKMETCIKENAPLLATELEKQEGRRTEYPMNFRAFITGCCFPSDYLLFFSDFMASGLMTGQIVCYLAWDLYPWYDLHECVSKYLKALKRVGEHEEFDYYANYKRCITDLKITHYKNAGYADAFIFYDDDNVLSENEEESHVDQLD